MSSTRFKILSRMIMTTLKAVNSTHLTVADSHLSRMAKPGSSHCANTVLALHFDHLPEKLYVVHAVGELAVQRSPSYILVYDDQNQGKRERLPVLVSSTIHASCFHLRQYKGKPELFYQPGQWSRISGRYSTMQEHYRSKRKALAISCSADQQLI